MQARIGTRSRPQESSDDSGSEEGTRSIEMLLFLWTSNGSVAVASPEKSMLGALLAISHGLSQPISKIGMVCPTKAGLVRFATTTVRNQNHLSARAGGGRLQAMAVATRPISLAHRSMSCEQPGRRGRAQFRRP
jgi:hypothetical protein